LALSAVASNAIGVTWEAQVGVEGYTVYQKDPGGKYEDVDETTETSYTAKDLAPGSEYCFKVQALRAGFKMTSEDSCISTAPLAASTPAGTSLSTPGQSTATATPTNTGGGTSRPTQPTTSGGATTTRGGTTPGTTGGGPSGTGGPGTVQFGPGDFVSVVWILSDDATEQLIASTLSQVNAKLVPANRTATYLLTRNYPSLRLSAGQTPDRLLLFYVPGFSSDSAARAFCANADGTKKFELKDCLAAQPQPATN
jgi:hypothetical protein